MKAIDFEILRGVESNGLLRVPLKRQPVRVATMINEALFEESGHEMWHNRTVFLEDRYHDWDWSDGRLRYYSRVAEKADVLVVYEMETEASESITDKASVSITHNGSVTTITNIRLEISDLAYNLQRIIDAGRAALPKHQGGPGENMVYLTPAMYDALEKAIQKIKGKK